jgi:hypothetical protein
MLDLPEFHDLDARRPCAATAYAYPRRESSGLVKGNAVIYSDIHCSHALGMRCLRPTEAGLSLLTAFG